MYLCTTEEPFECGSDLHRQATPTNRSFHGTDEESDEDRVRGVRPSRFGHVPRKVNHRQHFWNICFVHNTEVNAFVFSALHVNVFCPVLWLG